MSEQIYNGVETTLKNGITSATTVIQVTDPNGFPTVPTFRLRIEDELLQVTAVEGNNFTVMRGIEGTTAADHDIGSTISGVLTAGALYALKREPADSSYPLLSKASNQSITVSFDLSGLESSSTYTFPTSGTTLCSKEQLDEHIAGVGNQVHGLGTISTQNSNMVNVTGGNINGTVIGNTEPTTGIFTGCYSNAVYTGSTFNTSKQVVGERITGWTTPVGTSSRSVLKDTVLATQQDIAQALAQLIKDLMQHGLISE